MIAAMAIQIEAARQLVYRAAAAVDAGVAGREVAPLAAMAKCFATDVAMTVATDAVQIFGAAGVSTEYPSSGNCGTPKCYRSSRARTRSSVISSPTRCSGARIDPGRLVGVS